MGTESHLRSNKNVLKFTTLSLPSTGSCQWETLFRTRIWVLDVLVAYQGVTAPSPRQWTELGCSHTHLHPHPTPGFAQTPPISSNTMGFIATFLLSILVLPFSSSEKPVSHVPQTTYLLAQFSRMKPRAARTVACLDALQSLGPASAPLQCLLL